MKTILHIAPTLGLAILLSSCLYKEPVFTEDFSKVDDNLTGVWFAKEGDQDPRKGQFALCAPIDENRYILHHPARDDDSFYYEARPLTRQGRNLLQLQVLASFDGGAVKPDAARFTVLWIEPQADGSLVVRAPGGEGGLRDKTPAEVRKILEDPASDWGNLFGKGDAYRRLPQGD